MDHQPEIRFQEDGTLDLSVFPDLDPDEALDAADLESLHDTLVSDPIPELDQDSWTGILDGVFASDGSDVDDDLVPSDDPFVHHDEDDTGSDLGGMVGGLAGDDDADEPPDDGGPFEFDEDEAVDEITDVVVDTAEYDEGADDVTAEGAFADEPGELADEDLGISEFDGLEADVGEFDADFASVGLDAGLDDTPLFAEDEEAEYELPETGIEDLDY